MNNTKKTEFETAVVKPEVSVKENDKTLRTITIEDEFYLDNKINELENFINNNHGLGKSDNEKDLLYYTAQSTWRELVSRLKNMKYTFYLNRNQYNFITNLLLSKMEYDVNTIFLAIELTNMLGSWKTIKGNKDSKDDTEVKAYTTDSTEITYMYHLISTHKVKGLTHDTYIFAEILRKIGHISKIVSYYDAHCKSYNGCIQDWVSTFEENVFVEGKEYGRKEAMALSTDKTSLEDIKIKKTSKKKEEEKA